MRGLQRSKLAVLCPHHVTQRGNRREAIFFEDGDQKVYRDLLAEQAEKAGVSVWAYCMMPNHVHLILAPRDGDSLGRAVGETHRRYTNFINARGRWTGHLFQSRFASVVLDHTHLMRAVRYISLNPVRARLVERAEDWKWSSVCAHLAAKDDALVTVRPVLDRVPDFASLLRPDPQEDYAELRRSEGTGRPIGAPDFVAASNRYWEERSRVAHQAEDLNRKRRENNLTCYKTQEIGIMSPYYPRSISPSPLLPQNDWQFRSEC